MYTLFILSVKNGVFRLIRVKHVFQSRFFLGVFFLIFGEITTTILVLLFAYHFSLLLCHFCCFQVNILPSGLLFSFLLEKNSSLPFSEQTGRRWQENNVLRNAIWKVITVVVVVVLVVVLVVVVMGGGCGSKHVSLQFYVYLCLCLCGFWLKIA